MNFTKLLVFALFIFIISFLFSCYVNPDSVDAQTKKVDMKALSVPKNMAYIKSHALSKEMQEVLSYSGINSVGKNEIKIHTDNSHYFYFAAVVDFPENDNGGYSSHSGKLSSFKKVNGCFIYELCKDSTNTKFAEDILHSHLMFDNKTSSILNNDSLYVTLNGRTYFTMPEEMSLSGYSPNKFNDKYFDLNGIVPIFQASVTKPKNRDTDISSFILIGLMSYNKSLNYDFDSMFSSEAFTACVGFTHLMSESDTEYNLFNVDDFIVHSE